MNIKKFFGYFVPEPSNLSGVEQVRTVLAAFVAVWLLMLISWYSLDKAAVPLMLASMGASAVILFAAFNSPLAQPWSFVGSHLLAAAIGVSCARWVDALWLAASLSVALTLLAMLRLHCLHPPGGATALVPVLGGDSVHALGYQLVLTPVALNIVVLLLLAWIVNRSLGRKYPYRAKRSPAANPHSLKDPKASERLGVTEADVAAALQDVDAYLDVSEEDLNQVYRMAEAKARERHRMSPYCGDLMSRDLIVVRPETHQETAWQLLEKHKIKALPVVDEHHRVKGIVTLIDFLKPLGVRPQPVAAPSRRRSGVLKNLKRLSGTRATDQVVAEIMTANVFTARMDQHLLELMPQVCVTELHHIPVVDDQQKLVGIITSSDLLAALYLYDVNPQGAQPGSDS